MNPFSYTFAYPLVLLGLVLLPLLFWIQRKRIRRLREHILFPSVQILANRKRSLRERLSDLPLFVRYIALAAFIIALARPQSFRGEDIIETEGIDIVLTLDISGSMLAEDFQPNRLEAAKNITREFITGRIADRIGLVIFSRDALTQSPLTIDYSFLISMLSSVQSGMIEDGTAIGNAVANAVNRLRNSTSKTKIIILLTDGENNAGEISPVTAADIAREYGIRVYTIGIGTNGKAKYPVKTSFGIEYQYIEVNIDEGTLTQIAESTGGKYFRAVDNTALKDVYNEIDALEKSRVEITSFQSASEQFPGFLFFGILFLLLEFLLRSTVLRTYP